MAKKTTTNTVYFGSILLLILASISICWLLQSAVKRTLSISTISELNGIDDNMKHHNSLYIWNSDKYCGNFGLNKLQYLKVHGMYNTGTNALFRLLYDNCYGSEIQYTVKRKMSEYYHSKIKKKVSQNNASHFKSVLWNKSKHAMIISMNELESMEHKDMIEYMSTLHVILIKDPLTWFKSICKVSYHIKFVRKNWNKIYECLKSISSSELNGTKSMLLWHHNIFVSIIDLWNTFYGSWLNGNFTINNDPDLYSLYRVNNDKELIHLFKQNETLNNIKYINTPQSNVAHVMVKFEDLLFTPHIIGPKLCECIGGVWNQHFVLTNSTSKAHGHSRNRSQALMVYGNESYRYQQYSRNELQYIETKLNQSILNMFGYAI